MRSAEGFRFRTLAVLVLALGFLLSLVPANPAAAARADYAWRIDAVETGVIPYGATDVAVDSQGHPHVAFADSSRNRVRYASWDGEQWSVTSPPSAGSPFGAVSLVLDAQDLPHITYFDASESEIWYAHFTGFTWRVLEVDEAHYLGYHDIAVDSSGIPRVAYAAGNGDLKHARLDGLAWTRETADGDAVVAKHISLALDTQGRPRIAYYARGVLRFAQWIGYRWMTETADSDATPEFVSLALDRADTPKIAYRDLDRKTLRYIWWNGTAWLREVVDDEGDVGWDVDLALDSAGEPHISYYDRSRGMLKYALRADGVWARRIVDVQRVSGYYSGIALTEDDRPHFSYYRWGESSVCHAYGGDGVGIRTWPSKDVTPTSATLVGEVTYLGNASQIALTFEWRRVGEDWRILEAGTLSQPDMVSAVLDDLDPETTYEARAVASVGEIRIVGEPVSFTTPVHPTEPLLTPIAVGSSILVLTISVFLVYAYVAYRRQPRRSAKKRVLADLDEPESRGGDSEPP